MLAATSNVPASAGQSALVCTVRLGQSRTMQVLPVERDAHDSRRVLLHDLEAERPGTDPAEPCARCEETPLRICAEHARLIVELL
jgi:hypothetical protein